MVETLTFFFYRVELYGYPSLVSFWIIPGKRFCVRRALFVQTAIIEISYNATSDDSFLFFSIVLFFPANNSVTTARHASGNR